MLELRDLRVAYGAVEVIHGVDLEVDSGEVVGIVGPNGAGKTTLLRAICGLEGTSGGEVLFEGYSLTGLAPEQIARLGVALVPEGRHIFGTLTVEENLQLGARTERDSAHFERTLQRFPILGERLHMHADRLSGGEQQQLAIARALIGRPKLLVLDEPSLGLAPKTIDAIYELLEGLRTDGMTLLLVEQNATRTVAFCDRCVVLAGGAIRAGGTREGLKRDPDGVGAYLGGQP